MNCNCIGEANEKLKEQGIQIDFRIAARTVKRGSKTANELYSVVPIPTRNLNPKSRKQPLVLLSTFCPMCGRKVDPARRKAPK